MNISRKRKDFKMTLITWTLLAFQVLSTVALPEDLDLEFGNLPVLSIPTEPELDSAKEIVQTPATEENTTSDLTPAAATNKVVKTPEDQLQTLEQETHFEEANYDFRYQIHGGGNYYGHHESRRDEKTIGQYHVLLPDGRKQTVTYFADETGYHPVVTYEYVQPPSTEAPRAIKRNIFGEGFRPKRRAYRHSRRVLTPKIQAR